MTTLKHALWYIKTKSYTKFELNMSKHVGENCGKLHICKSLKLKRSITPAKTKIEGIRTWSYVHKNKVIHKISDQYVKACRRKVRKTVTDGRTETRTDGHHHTIIRPVWRRAYKMSFGSVYKNYPVHRACEKKNKSCSKNRQKIPAHLSPPPKI